ncbi:MAG: NUDIX hydrolase [bacterium]|nr:NUDIX hydrolase [bacterium]
MQQPKRTVAETKHLRLVERDGWSYAERANASGVVCVVACTNDGKILLVEQYRPPVGCNVIELPAGLAGDLTDQADEAFEQAAQRELLEETGYRATELTQKTVVASSAGLTNETVTMFVANEVQKVGPGGGDESEEIRVHEVPLAEVNDWLVRVQADGRLVDSRVYAGLYFLSQNGSFEKPR